MKERDIQRQTELVFNLYRDSLEDVMDSDIDDELLGKNNNLRPSKPSTPAVWPGKAVPLLSGLLGNSSRATTSKKNTSKPLPTSNSSPRLPSSIVSQDPLSLLSKSNDCRLKKMKKSVRLASGGLVDSSYSTGQSTGTLSQGSLAVGENNAKSMANFGGKLT